MATVTPDELLKLWRSEQISAELAITYLIQNQARHEVTIITTNISHARLRLDVDRLIDHTGLEAKEKKKPARKR